MSYCIVKVRLWTFSLIIDPLAMSTSYGIVYILAQENNIRINMKGTKRFINVNQLSSEMAIQFEKPQKRNIFSFT